MFQMIFFLSVPKSKVNSQIYAKSIYRFQLVSASLIWNGNFNVMLRLHLAMFSPRLYHVLINSRTWRKQGQNERFSLCVHQADPVYTTSLQRPHEYQAVHATPRA